MKFRYTGYDVNARKVSGSVEAGSKNELIQILRGQNIRPLKISQTSEGFSLSSAGQTEINLDFLSSARPTSAQMATFVRQLAALLNAGITIVQALKALGDESENKKFGIILLKIRADIEGGQSFSQGLLRNKDVFDNIFINLIAAAETSGSLDKILVRLAIYYEKSAKLKRRLTSASIYPFVVLTIGLGVTLGLVMFVVPKFKGMFGSKALPVPTQILLDLSNFLTSNIHFVILGIVGVITGIVYSFRAPEVREVIDPILLKLPIVGPIAKKAAVARFARTLGTLLQSGVSILDALILSSRVTGNSAIEKVVMGAQKAIKEGHTVSGPLARSGLFPAMAISMITVGEQTGQLDQMLEKLAEFYEDEVDAILAGVSSIIEPILIVLVGILVAAVVVPIYLPMFERASDF